MLKPLYIIFNVRQMLLPFFWHVIANFLTDVIVMIKADVIAYVLFMADVIAIFGRCYCQLCGRC